MPLHFPPCFVVRHGQTKWNKEGRLQGQRDIPLNETGIEQARKNGERLADMLDDPAAWRFVCSPMGRTRQTLTEILRKLGREDEGYETDDRIKELSFGDWEGFTFDELEVTSPGLSERRNEDKWNFMPDGPGAENYQLLEERLTPFLQEVADAGQSVLMVTHGGVIRCMFKIVAGWDEADASTMDVPQDQILRLDGRSLEWI